MKKRLVSFILALILISGLSFSALATEPKLVALTYDDGPTPGCTEKLLDGLAERGAKATFFVMGNSLTDPHGAVIKENAAIVQRAHAEGHQIGNHSYSHPRLTELSNTQAINELVETDSALRDILGRGAYFIRPPYGDYNAAVCALASQPLIMWTLDPAWEAPGTDAKSQHDHIVKNVRDGDIILLHDWKENDIETTFMVIDTLKAQGYEFVTVRELMRLRNLSPKAGQVYKSVPTALPFDEAQLTSHWAYGSIAYAMEKGIMIGDGEGFKPDGKLTRAMAVTLLHRMAGSPEAESAPFTDLSQDWYMAAVNWAYSQGLINGMGDNRFAPDESMTKEQFYTLMCRREGLDSPAPDKILFPDDDKISDWARGSVMQLRNAGFVSQNDIEIFRPGAAVTRAEAAELLHYLAENEEK